MDRSLVPDSPTSEASCNSTQQSSNDSRNNRECNDLFWGSTNKRPSLRSKFSKQKYWKLSAEQREMYNKHLVSQCFPGFPKVIYGLRMESEIAELGNQDEPNKIKVENGQGNLDVINNSPRNETIPEIPVANSTENTKATLPSPYHEAVPSQTVHLNRYTSETNITNSIPQSSLVEQNTPQSQLSIMFEQTATLCGRVEAIEQQLAKLEKLGYFTPENLYDYSTSNLNNNTKEYFVGGKIISTVDSGNIEQNAMSNRELNSETEHDQNKIVNVIDKHLSEDFAKNSLSSNESLRIDPESKLLSNPGKAGVSECEKHDCLSKGLELYENNSDENVQHGCTEPSQIGNSSQTQNILTFNSATDLTSFLYNSDKKFHTKEAKGIHHACDWILANKQPRITSQIRVCSTLSYNTWWCRLTGSENVILPVIYRLTKEEWVCNIPANATERCVVVAETVNKHQSNIKLLQYSAATSESQSMYQINAIESQLVVLLKYNLGKDWHVTVVLRSVPYASNISEELEKMTGTPDSQQCESTFVQIIKLCSMNGTSDNQFDILFETGTNHQPILQTFDLDIVKEETILNDTNYEVLSEILNYKGEKIKKQHEKKEERQSNTKLVYFDGIELITQNLLGTTLKDSGEENAIHSKKILKQNCELFSAEFNKISYSESEFSEHIVRLLSINRQVENQEIYPQAEITRKHISENTSARKESTPESSSKEVQTQGDSKSNSLNVCKINLPPLLDPSSPEENVDRRFLLDNGCTYKRGHVFESAKSTDTSIDSTGKSTEASIDSTRSSLCKQDNSLLHSEVVTSPNVCSDENGTTILPENVQSVETCKKSSDVKLSNQIEEKFGVRAEYNLLINSNRKEKENKVKTTKTSITTLEKPSEYTRVNQALYSQRYGDNISLSLPTESFTQANESQTAKGEFHSKAETSSVKSDWISAIDNLEPIYSASTDNSKSDNTSKKQENFTLETVAPVSSCANSDTVTKVHTDVSRSGSNERPGVLQEKMESFSENNFSEEISTLTRGNKMNSGEKEICKVSPVPKYGLSPTKAEPEIMETNEPDQLNKNVFENFETDLECKDSSVKKESSKSKTEEVELIPSDKTNKNASFQESKIICSEKKVLVDSNNTKERSKTTEIKETAINVDDSYEQHATLKLTNVSFNEISNRKDRNVSSKHPNIENSTRIVHSVPKLEEISNANKTDESQCKEIKITESIKRTTKYFKEENICTGISNLQANDTNMSFKSTTSGMTKTISKADVSYGQISNSKESPQVPSVTSGSERTKLDEKTVQSTQNDVIVSPSIRDTIKPQNSQQKELENVNQSLQNIQIKKSDILVKNPEISNIHDNKGDITRKELDSATSGVQDYQIHSAQTIKEAKIESRKDERFQRSCKEIMSTVNDGIYEIALEGPIIEEKANQNIVHTSKNELQKSSLITQNQISQTSQKKSPGKEEPKTLANISIPVEMKLSSQLPQSSDLPKGAMQRMEPIKPEATKLSENIDSIGPIIEEKANQNIVHTSKNELQKSSLTTQNQISQTSQKISPGKEEPKTLANISIPVEMKLSSQLPQSSDFPKGAMQRMEPIKPEATKLSENIDSIGPIIEEKANPNIVHTSKNELQKSSLTTQNQTSKTSQKKSAGKEEPKTLANISIPVAMKLSSQLPQSSDLPKGAMQRMEPIKPEATKLSENIDSIGPIIEEKANQNIVHTSKNETQKSSLTTQISQTSQKKSPGKEEPKTLANISIPVEMKLSSQFPQSSDFPKGAMQRMEPIKPEATKLSENTDNAKNKISSVPIQSKSTKEHTVISRKSAGQTIPPISETNRTMNTSVKNEEVLKTDKVKPTISLENPTKCLDVKQDLVSSRRENIKVKSVESTDSCRPNKGNKERLDYNENKNRISNSDKLVTEEKIIGKNKIPINTSENANKIAGKIEVSTESKLLVDKLPTASNDIHTQKNLPDEKVQDKSISNKSNTEKIKSNSKNSDTFVTERSTTIETKFTKNISSETQHETSNFTSSNEKEVVFKDEMQKKSNLPQKSVVCTASDNITSFQNKNEVSVRSEGTLKGTINKEPLKEDAKSTVYVSDNLQLSKNTLGVEDSAKQSKIPTNVKPGTSNVQKDPSTSNSGKSREDCKQPNLSMNKVPNIPLSGINNENKKHLEKHIPTYDTLKNNNTTSNTELVINKQLVKPAQQSNINSPENLKLEISRGKNILPDEKSNQFSMENSSGACLQKRHMKETEIVIPKPSTETEVQSAKSGISTIASQSQTTQVEINNSKGSSKSTKINMPKEGDTSRDSMDCLQLKEKNCKSESVSISLLQESSNISGNKNCIGIQQSKPSKVSSNEEISESKILGNKTIGQEEKKISLASSEKINSKPVQDPISNINELQKHQKQVSGVLTSPQQNIPDSLKTHSKKSEDGKFNSLSASGTSNDNIARNEVKIIQSSSKTGTNLKPQIDTVSRSMSDERKYVSTTDTIKEISSNDTGDKKPSTINPKSVNTSPEIKPTITSPTNIKQLPTASQGTKSIQEENKMSPTSNVAFSVDSSSLEPKQLSFTENISERKILGNKETIGQEERKTSTSEKVNSKTVQDKISNINELQKHQQISGVLTSSQQNIPDSLISHSKKSEDGKVSSLPASGTSAPPDIGNDNLAKKEVKNTESSSSRSMSAERKYVSTTDTFKKISSNDTGDKKKSTICPISVNTSAEIKPTITSPTNIKQLPTASQGTKSIQEQKKMSPTSNEPFSVHSSSLETKQLSFTEYMSERKILGNKKTSGQQENKMSLTSPTEKLNSKPVEDPISNINELQIRQQQVSGVLTSPQQNVPDSLKNNSKKSEDCKLSSPSASGISASPYIGNDNLARKEVKNTESCLKTGTILKPQIDTVNRSMSDERKYVSTTETFKQISSKSSNDTGDKKTSMICPKSENTSPEIKPNITSPTNIKQLPTASQGTKSIQEENEMFPTSNEAFSVHSSSLGTKQLSFTEYMSERKILGNKKTSGQEEKKMSLTSSSEKVNSKPVQDPISNINELHKHQKQISGVLISPQQNEPESLKSHSKKYEDGKCNSLSASGTSAPSYIGNDNVGRKEVKNTESSSKTGTILKPQIDTVSRSMSDERKYVSTTDTFKKISSIDTGDKKTSTICPKSVNTSPEIKPTITSPTNIKQLPTASQGTKCIQEEKKMSPTSNEAFSVDSSSLVTKQLSFTEYISERKILGNKKTSGQEENKMSLKSSENANSKPIQDPISNINELQKRQQQVSGVLTSPQQNVPDSLKNHSKKSEDGKLSSPSASGTSASPYIGNDNLSRKEVKNTESCLKTGTILKPQIDTVSRSMSDERKYVSTTETFKQISSKDTGDKKPSMICPKSVNTSPEIKPTITTTNVKQLPTASQGTRSTSTDLSQKSEKQLKKTSTCETNKSSSSVKEKPDTSKLPQLGKLSDGNVKSTSLVKENKQGNDKRSQSNATQNDSVIPIKAEQASSTNKNSKQIVSSQTNKVSTSEVKVSSKVVADKQVVPPKENSPKFKTESKVPKKC